MVIVVSVDQAVCAVKAVKKPGCPSFQSRQSLPLRAPSRQHIRCETAWVRGLENN